MRSEGKVIKMPKAQILKPPFRLVSDSLSADTAICLKQLLDEADETIGIVFAVMYKDRTFITNTAGECRRNPVFARGLLLELDDELSHRTKR